VSSAYYALFHLLTSETAKNWKRPAERATLERMFNHDPMGKVCTAKRDELREFFKSKPPENKETECKRHLKVITEAFADMLQKRHTADYDKTQKWTRVEVWERIDAVKEAFTSWKAIRDHHEAQNFLVTLLLKERR